MSASNILQVTCGRHRAARKHGIATGLGEAHGLRLDLSAWGMDLADPP